MQTGVWRTLIHTIDDKTIIRALKDISTIAGDTSYNIRFMTVPGLWIDWNELSRFGKKVGSYSATQIMLVQQLNPDVRYTVSFVRTDFKGTSQIPPGFIEVILQLQNPVDKIGDQFEVLLNIQDKISKLDIAPVSVGGEPGDVLRQLMVGMAATHQQAMEQLGQSVEDMLERRRQLDDDAASAAKSQREEHEAAIAALTAEREQLERQSHMAERRKLSATLMNKMKQSGRDRPLSRIHARFSGLNVFLACVFLGLGAGYLSYLGIQTHDRYSDIIANLISELREVNTPDETASLIEQIRNDSFITSWYLIVRSVLASFVSIGAFSYAATWMKRYYDEDIASAREQERFEADISRASWVIEAIHEVKHEAKGELPSEWVQAVTRNLFADRNSEVLDERSQALKALMGFTANASFGGPNGAQFDIGKKGAKDLSKAGE